MTKLPTIILCLGLAACSTAQVQQTCGDAQDILAQVAPYEGLAPPEVHAALALLRTGPAVCQSPQYAAARNLLVGWLARARGAVVVK